MTDTRLDKFLTFGTAADRGAFTPDPPPDILVVFFETDTGDFYVWDGSWTALVAAGAGLLAANNLSDVASAATARANLGLAIGTNVLGIGGGTLTGALTLNADPASALQAATKQYVDNLAAGLDVKASVLNATTANVALTGEQTIDGVLTSASRILVKDQTAPEENGIYVTAAGAWTRAADMDSWAEVPAANVWVEQGTVNADTAFVCTANAGGTLNTTAITWVLFGGTGAFAGSGPITASGLSMATARLLGRTTASTGAVEEITVGGGLSFTAGALSVNFAVAADFRAGTNATKPLATDQVWAAAADVVLTPGTNVALDLATGFNFTLAMGGNYTLDNPTNTKPQSGVIEIVQDGTGSRTLAYGTSWEFAGGTPPVLSTAAGAKDLLFYQVRGPTSVFANLVKAVA